MEKNISAAAGLPQSGSSGYKQSLERNWQLMDQLSAGKTKIVASYLKWMKAISIPYYQDFVEYGSKEGRDWLMDMQFADEAPPGCQELLKMDVRQMNAQRGHQWVNAMTQCIQTDINLQNSSAAAKAIWNYLIRLVEFMVPDPDAGGDAGQMLETTIQMQQLLQFIWKHRSIFDVTERVEICGVARCMAVRFLMFSAGISGGKFGQRILRHCMKRKALPSCLPIAHMMPIMIIVDMLGADTRKKKRAKHTVRRCRRNPEIFLISYRRKKAAHLKQIRRIFPDDESMGAGCAG
mgnify:CR=1 FL=1